MNDEHDRTLQRLFAAYAPTLSDESFLAHTTAALIRQHRSARVRSVIGYVLLGLIGAVVAVTTAAPLSALSVAVEKTFKAASFDLSPLASQGLVYVVTAAVLILGRRRIRAFLGPG